MRSRQVITFFATVLLTAGVGAAEPAVHTDGGSTDKNSVVASPPAYSPYANRAYPTRPLFGDTHLHTALSMDAGMFGARNLPKDAYALARGEQVTAANGMAVKLSRPLDFLVVADHSDGMGMITDLKAGKPELLAVPEGKRWYDMMASGQGGTAAIELITAFAQGKLPDSLKYEPGTAGYRNTWKLIVDSAEAANEPGRFTALIGYEWTSLVKGNNLHRNVILRDGAAKALMVEPYSTAPPLGSPNPRDLWKWLDDYERRTGGSALAIAHNGNLSNGAMFPVVDYFSGKPLDKGYAQQSARWEPLYETTQTKGDGEAHPLLSPNDEMITTEIWDKGNLDLSEAKKPEMLQHEYARAALKNGLMLEQKLGVNPYKFGLIGSTDAHTGLAAIEEENFFGKTPTGEPSPKRAEHPFIKSPNGTVMGWEVGASGYAAVWATENTREAIFDAMKRKETYATTGSRMVVRFFGGFGFEAADAGHRLPAEVGYAKGVPMGADLPQPPKGAAPSFLVAALKDPIGANLDRIQVVKGWVDAKGVTHEKVYDAAWSGGRKPGADGKLPSVGSTVDVANATWTNTIGAPELIAVWQDPEFDPKQRAFYYARVIEIPTPRWTAYDAKRFGIKMAPEVRMTVTERAYTSPIWYTPGKG